MSTAHAELLVAPTRVVLEPGERTAELVLVNNGTEKAAFRVTVENRRMLLNGSMETADDARPDELFAKDFIRFAPRRVVLEPGARQTVRISAMVPADLPPGEYRSHLRLMSAPLSAGRSLERASESTSEGLSISLVAIRSITIPLIVRSARLDVGVQIDGASLERSEDGSGMVLVSQLRRSGTKSTYGDLKVYLKGQAEPVYFARGIAVYTPNDARHVRLPLPDEILSLLRNQEVRVTYESSDPTAPGVLAEYRGRLTED